MDSPQNRITEWRRGEAPRYGNASGYGPKQPTGYMVRVNFETKWRRVYCAIYSNAGSVYYILKGQRVFFSDCDLPTEECAVR